MILSSFEKILSSVQRRRTTGVIAVAAAHDRHTLEAVLAAWREGLAVPLLTGDAEKIRTLWEELSGEKLNAAWLIDCADDAAACAAACAQIREGRADILMKGAVDSRTYLGAVVNRENGLGTGRLMSHFSLLEVPGYPKLLAAVDGGMVPYPTLEQKKQIILNTVEAFHALGCEMPKVGVLCCTEKVNLKMPETTEAAELQAMNRRGELPGCIVAGPISYDCAMSREISRIKGYESPVSGDVDILLAPDIHAGNILGKALTVTAHAKMAGYIVGAACPVVMTSRGASAEEKRLSIALAIAAAAAP